MLLILLLPVDRLVSYIASIAMMSLNIWAISENFKNEFSIYLELNLITDLKILKSINYLKQWQLSMHIKGFQLRLD